MSRRDATIRKGRPIGPSALFCEDPVVEARRTKFTEVMYLAAERVSEEKNEYWRGEVWCMAGGTPRHAALTSRLARRIGEALDASGCEPLSEQRVYLEAARSFVYPDVSVACPPLQMHPTDEHGLVNPRLVAEVLSPHTFEHDRTTKRDAYLDVEGLAAYVMVWQDRVRVEVVSAAGTEVLGPGDVIQVSALEMAVAVDDLYDGLFEFPGAVLPDP